MYVGIYQVRPRFFEINKNANVVSEIRALEISISYLTILVVSKILYKSITFYTFVRQIISTMSVFTNRKRLNCEMWKTFCWEDKNK